MGLSKDGKHDQSGHLLSMKLLVGSLLTRRPRFSNHWRWVVMLIVLLLGLLLLAVAAVLLKRRYSRRREARELGVQPDLSMWAPHGRGMHDFGLGEGYGAGGEKGKGKQESDVGVGKPAKSHTEGGRRLTKSWL